MSSLTHVAAWLVVVADRRKKVKMKVSQSCPTPWDLMDYLVREILQARMLEWVAFPFSKRSSQPGIEPRSPALRADYLPAETPGKPKNTGVGRLSFLQQIFLTRGLLHCRQILLPTEPQGSPCRWKLKVKDLEISGLSWISKEVSIKTQAPLKE